MEHLHFVYIGLGIVTVLFLTSCYILSKRSEELTTAKKNLNTERDNVNRIQKTLTDAETARGRYREELQTVAEFLSVDVTGHRLVDGSKRIIKKLQLDKQITGSLKEQMEGIYELITLEESEGVEYGYMFEVITAKIKEKSADVTKWIDRYEKEKLKGKDLKEAADALKEVAKIYGINPELATKSLIGAFRKDVDAFNKSCKAHSEIKKENDSLKIENEGLKKVKNDHSDIYYEKTILKPLRKQVGDILRASIDHSLSQYTSKQTKAKMRGFVSKMTPIFNGKIEAIKIQNFISKK